MLLAGAFQRANQADDTVLQQLGSNAHNVQALAEQLRGHPHAAIIPLRGRWENTAYTWDDHSAAWRHLACLLSAADLARFQCAVLDVLPKRREAEAPTWYSKWLLEGLGRTLALLGNNDNCVSLSTLGDRAASHWSDETVRKLFTPDAIRWEALAEHDSLPLLAEAAPQAFLDALEQSLHLDEKGVGALFRERFPIGTPHSVLRALETLGWDVELMPQVARSLAILAEFDPDPDRASHPRPLSCLQAMLRYALPQTNASGESRLAVLTELARDQRTKTMARRLLLRLLPVGLGLLHVSGRRPRFLPLTLPPQDAQVTQAEAFGQVKTYVELLVELAGMEAQHWADLVSAARTPHSLACDILDRLTLLHPQIHDPQALIWTKLRGILHWMRGASEPARSHATFQRRFKLTQEVFALFEPADPVVRMAWLFEARPTIEKQFDDFRDEAKYIHDRRKEALHDLWQREDRWLQLERLTQLGDPPEPKIIATWLSFVIIQTEWCLPLEVRLLKGASFAPFSSIAPDFLARRLHDRDIAETAALLRRLTSESRHDEAIALTMAALDISRDQERSIWELLDDIGAPLRDRYWHEVHTLWLHNRARPLQELAIRRLLDFGNLQGALRLVSGGREVPASAIILDVLELVSQQLANTPRLSPIDLDQPFERNQITEALSRLEQDPAIDCARARQVEVSLLDFLFSGTDYAPTFVINELSSNPALIAQWASDNDGLNRLYRVLHLWHGYPGENLPLSERAQILEQWCSTVLRLLAEKSSIALFVIGMILARPEPDAPDGLWPCLTARRFLDEIVTDPASRSILARDLRTAKLNSRGMTSRAIGEGGGREHATAEQYRHSALRLKARWKHTAAMLQELARAYDQDALEHDAEADVDQWRYRMKQPVDEENARDTEPLFPLTHVKLENFRAMRELDIDVLDPHMNVFIGRNASGKTTVLDAIAIGLAEVQDQMFGSKIVDQLLDERRDRRINWISPTESRQEPYLSLQFWGQAKKEKESPSVPQPGEAPEPPLEAERWGVGKQVSIRKRREVVNENESLAARLWSSREVLLRRDPGPPAVPISAYYSAKRAVTGDVLKQEPRHAEDSPEGDWHLSRAAGFDGAHDAGAGYQALVSWWRSQQTAEDELQKQKQDFSARLPALEAVRKAVEQAVRTAPEGGMRCSNPRTKAGRSGLVVDFDPGDGRPPETLELAQLSDGFRTHLTLIMDLARRMVLANPPPDGDLQRDRWGTRSYAVVLIDEVDLHLHPSWQRTVLNGLCAAFPNTQFIVTTHSPQVLATVPRNQVKLLRDCQLVKQGLFVQGRDTNGLLEDVFGVPSRPADMLPRLRELFELLDEEQYAQAEEKLRDIEQLLGPQDEAVVRARWILDMARAMPAVDTVPKEG